MPNVFIYALTDPWTHEIRYIGKATDPDQRLKQHLTEVRRGHTYKGCWIRALRAAGKTPRFRILKSVPETEWEWWECAYIRNARMLGFSLTNGTDGGDCGPSMKGKKQSPESIAKRVAKNAGQKRSPEQCEKNRVSRLGNKNCLGRKQSEEHRAHNRAARLGKKLSPEHCANISAALTGKKRGPHKPRAQS